jgi:phosphate transport system ATP-binding protein
MEIAHTLHSVETVVKATSRKVAVTDSKNAIENVIETEMHGKLTEGSHGAMSTDIFDVTNLNLYYGKNQALKNISMKIGERSITAIIGPSGCGKSTFLRCMNRMNDLVPGVRVTGELRFKGKNIYDRDVDVVGLRKDIGMVFQKPNPFTKSIYENVAWGAKLNGFKAGIGKPNMDEWVEYCLRKAALWDEVKDKLMQSGLSLSGGQQQRLCIARTLAVSPEVILMDEPASALDPIATLKIEELMRELAEEYTIIVVTHNMQQAARVSDFTAFFSMNGDRAGFLVEYGNTNQIFTIPQHKMTEDYVTGRFG